jgi:hypothetical protein
MNMKKLPLLLALATPLLCAAQVHTDVTATEAAPALNTASQPSRAMDAIDQLHDKLKVTPAQQPLWDAYVARLNTYTQQFYRERPALPSEDEPATQQLTRLVMNHENRLAALEDIEQAAKALYAQLNADQKKVANLWLLASIPTFTGAPSGTAGGGERRPEMRQGGEMRRRGGGGMGGMGSGRF